MSDEQLVPNGYFPIAVRDDRQGKCVISYNPELKRFYFVVNKAAAGPFNMRDLQQLVENIKDVISMKGNFHYISEYDASGERSI